ncbi:hypothetical protein SO802_013820 [Lithocarpus litseifolius]|uniref:Uncharacterized protein n=1 Tax=Lithocarpus litseifolius TaxID=425828 RepID=A0AAW2D843_9ROSI
MNLIPLSFLSKMGMYDIEMHGANVKVNVVDNPALIGVKMDELRSSLQTSGRQVVGLDIKFIETDGFLIKSKFLLLCVGSYCLMIQLPDSLQVSDTIGQFLSDDTICFLGTGMSKIVSELDSFHFCAQDDRLISIMEPVNFKTGVEVGLLAAKILKKPNVENYGLAPLAGEVGMDIKEPISECPNWNAKVFSHEEVKPKLPSLVNPGNDDGSRQPWRPRRRLQVASMATVTASGGLDGGGLERILDLGHRLGHNGARRSRPSSRSWRPQRRLQVASMATATALGGLDGGGLERYLISVSV